MSEHVKILIVDDDELVRNMLERQLTRAGYDCHTAEGGMAALERLREDMYDVTLLDLAMPDLDGFGVLSAVAKADIDTEPVVLTSYGDVPKAVEAMKLGAFDFIEKPAEAAVLCASIERALDHHRLKRHARAMAEIAEQWQVMFDAVSDLIAVIDTNHRFVRVNKAMAARLGHSPEELIGRPCYELVHNTSDPPACCAVVPPEDHTQERRVGVHEWLMDGCFQVRTFPLYGAQGRLVGVVHVARDITAEKQAEEDMRRAHREAERLLSSMSSFLIGVDTDLRVTRWNVAAEATFGIRAADAVGKPLTECGMSVDWDVLKESATAWQTANKPVRLPEMAFVRADGTRGILGITVNPIMEPGSPPEGFFLMGADITERRNLETQLAHAQKMESIGQLAAGIAHEINTPTQYVGDNLEFLREAFAGASRLLAKYAELAEAAKTGSVPEALLTAVQAAAEEADLDYLSKHIPRAIEQSLEGVGRVAKIVRAMKEFSHPGTTEKTPTDLNRAIESTITVARNEWKYVAEMVTDFDPNLPAVMCLPGEFNQVILNLLINATHAIAEVVGDGSKGKGTITVSTRRDSDWAEVRISDTGSGIPENIRGRIFDPFFTTKEVGKGTGQGLTIAHHVVVDKHGGTITFETEPGKGTTFIVRIPIAEAHHHESRA